MNTYEVEWRFKECEVYNTSIIGGKNKREAVINIIKLIDDKVVIGDIVKL